MTTTIELAERIDAGRQVAEKAIEHAEIVHHSLTDKERRMIRWAVCHGWEQAFNWLALRNA